MASTNEGRPYRSHKIPACNRCRKRKLRCEVEVPGQPCRLCKNSNASCLHNKRDQDISETSDNANVISHNSANLPAKRRRVDSRHNNRQTIPSASLSRNVRFPSQSTPPENQTNNAADSLVSLATSTSQNEASGGKSSMIIGPVMAEDVQMIETYMSSSNRSHLSRERYMYNTVSDNPEDPVLYLSVPRRRQGLSASNRPGEKQREILEQILGSHIDDVVALYFEHIHPSFPVLDEEHFVQLYRTGNKSLSAALVCDLATSALIYWNRSSVLCQFPRPDLGYAWNLAVAALHEEFLAPSMSTINAALLDLTGRPTTSIAGNTINSSRTVGLSHVLGLNRDPQTWKISDAEKRMRVRLWWGVLIHDTWSSFAHGVPTCITKDQYEVPIPTIELLLTSGIETHGRVESARCFIALCTLTKVLGNILPLVYNRRQRPEAEVSKMLRRLELEIDDWEESEPARLSLAEREDKYLISGASSLKLGFLSAKMLIRRIAFRAASHGPDPSQSEMRQYSQAMLRESARSIITFFCSLRSSHLGEFWSPYTAYHMASATTILLRCTIETPDPLVAQNCKDSMVEFLNWVRRAKEQDDWDLVDICLAQCEGPIMRICSERTSRPSHQAEENSETQQLGRNMQSQTSDLFNCFEWNDAAHMGPFMTDTQNDFNGFEYPWADLWDNF